MNKEETEESIRKEDDNSSCTRRSRHENGLSNDGQSEGEQSLRLSEKEDDEFDEFYSDFEVEFTKPNVEIKLHKLATADQGATCTRVIIASNDSAVPASLDVSGVVNDKNHTTDDRANNETTQKTNRVTDNKTKELHNTEKSPTRLECKPPVKENRHFFNFLCFSTNNEDEEEMIRNQETSKVDRNRISVSEIEIKRRHADFLATTSAEALFRTASMEQIAEKMSEGAYFWKIKGVNKYYYRYFKVDKTNMSLVAESKKWWSPGGLTSSVASEGVETTVRFIDIVEIREGWKTDTFNRLAEYKEKTKDKETPDTPTEQSEPKIEEVLCFSIVYGRAHDVLDLMALTKEDKDLWVSGLHSILESVQALHQDRIYDMWLRKKFEKADKNKDGVLVFDEICSLLTNLNLKLDKQYAKQLFNATSKVKRKKDSQSALDSQGFVDFYHALLKMPEIEKVYDQYCNEEKRVITADDLLAFFQTEQGKDDWNTSNVKKIIEEFELSDLKQEHYLSFDGFYHLLLSDYFNIYNSEHQKKIHQDMTRPLAHYYINSSHNTYLTGHQLAGESSVEGYISALKQGCRLVELDLWDGENGEPIIYHGHTLTSKITLSDVLKDAIKPYAFKTSPYPVILSIENHLSVEQQIVMVKLFKQILHDNLLTDPVSQDIKELPSPEKLKNKIIIKAKKPAGVEIEEDDEADDPDTIDYIDSEDGSKKKRPKPMAPELAQVVNVCEGKKFVSFQTSFENDSCVHFPSLRENKARSLFDAYPEEFVNFTQRQIAKIYPTGTRTSSSNMKPYPFWSVGAQVVTLNMQTKDKATFYNEALFRSNGNCGYVLKPDILTGDVPYSPLTMPASLQKVLRVKIINGQHLPSSGKKDDIVDPYIQLKVRGHPADEQKQRTRTVKNNGFNPVWNEVLEVRMKVPDIALVYFSVRDESSYAKDPVLAMACLPFTSLCTGYRLVHLTDITGKILSLAALFVKVSINDS